MTKPHHTGTYTVAARRLRDTANATPSAVCSRCGRTLVEHAPHANGRPAQWTAEHTMPGSMTWVVWPDVTTTPPPGDWLAISASTCNYSAGNTPVAPIVVTTRRW